VGCRLPVPDGPTEIDLARTRHRTGGSTSASANCSTCADANRAADCAYRRACAGSDACATQGTIARCFAAGRKAGQNRRNYETMQNNLFHYVAPFWWTPRKKNAN
jgi:hypothetical protein